MMGRADTERLLGAPALRYTDPAASRHVSPADLWDPLPPGAPAALRSKIECWREIGKFTYRAGEVRTHIRFWRALTSNIPAPKERFFSINVYFEREGEPWFEP
jgi:hypothetical protein